MSYTESWQKLEETMGGRVTLSESPENIRKQYDGLIQFLIPQLPAPSEGVESKDGEVDGVQYRVYTPKDAASKGKLPVGIWMHGGGLVVGDLNSDDLLCRGVAEHASTIIVSVDYRLAPEHKAPTQLQDCLNVYKWAYQNADSIGGDQSKFWVYGGSAGGLLAFQVANRLIKDPAKRKSIRGIVAVVPGTTHYKHVPEEYKSQYKSYEENATNVPIIDKASMEIFYDAAAVKPDDPETFIILDTENHKNYPPTYFASCELDPLRDDSTIMEAALKKAGVPTKHDYYKNLPHYFWIFPSVPEGGQFIGNLIGGVHWVISQM